MSSKISIITVCYNSAKTIEKTLQSISNQTYKNIECIIVDGNSTDDTLNIIKKYENALKINWISEKDEGLYDAMNKGIKMSTGDYIGILNSDDIFYYNSTLEQVAKFIDDNVNIDALTGDIVQHTSDGKVIRKYSSKNWTPAKLKIGFMPPHPSVFIKKELFDKFGNYRKDYKIGADYELIIRFFLKNKIHYKYSGITTTSMEIGGASSSGLKSYRIITREIKKAFEQNSIQYDPLKVQLRFLWKIIGYLNKS